VRADPCPVDQIYGILNQKKIDVAIAAGRPSAVVPLPLYQCFRGSNKVEARHRVTNALLIGRGNIRAEIAGAILSELDFRSNVRAGIKYTGEIDTGIIRLERLQYLSNLFLRRSWPDVTLEMGYKPMDPNYSTKEVFYFDLLCAPAASEQQLRAAAASSGTASKILPSSSSTVSPLPTHGSMQGGRASTAGEAESDSDDEPEDDFVAEGDAADFLLREVYSSLDQGGEGDGGDAATPRLTPGAAVPSSAAAAAAVPSLSGLGRAGTALAETGAGASLDLHPLLMPSALARGGFSLPPESPTAPAAPGPSAAPAKAATASGSKSAPAAPFSGAVPASASAMAWKPTQAGSVSTLSTVRPGVLSSGVHPLASTPRQLVAASASAPAASGTGIWHPTRHLLWSQQCRPVQTDAEKSLFLELLPRFSGDWGGMAVAWNKIALERLASDASLNPDVASQVYIKASAHLKEYHDEIMKQEQLRMALTPRRSLHNSTAGAGKAASVSGHGSGPGAAGLPAFSGPGPGAAAGGGPPSAAQGGENEVLLVPRIQPSADHPRAASFGQASAAEAAAAARSARMAQQRQKRGLEGGAAAVSVGCASAAVPVMHGAQAAGDARPIKRGGVGRAKFCALCNWPVKDAGVAGFHHGKSDSAATQAAGAPPSFCKMVTAPDKEFRLPCAKCLGALCRLHEGEGKCCAREPGELESMGITFERIQQWGGWSP